MIAILFLAAVLFAIPTAGVSLIAFFAVYFGKKYFETQSKLDIANQRGTTWIDTSEKAVPHNAVKGANQQTVPPAGTGIEAIRKCVLESHKTGEVVRFRPIVEQDIQKFFSTYATQIPSKWALNEVGLVRFGFVHLPSAGTLVLCVALLIDEAVVHVSGSIPAKSILTNRDELLELQEESFRGYWSAIQADVEKMNSVILNG